MRMRPIAASNGTAYKSIYDTSLKIFKKVVCQSQKSKSMSLIDSCFIAVNLIDETTTLMLMAFWIANQVSMVLILLLGLTLLLSRLWQMYLIITTPIKDKCRKSLYAVINSYGDFSKMEEKDTNMSFELLGAQELSGDWRGILNFQSYLTMGAAIVQTFYVIEHNHQTPSIALLVSLGFSYLATVKNLYQVREVVYPIESRKAFEVLFVGIQVVAEVSFWSLFAFCTSHWDGILIFYIVFPAIKRALAVFCLFAAVGSSVIRVSIIIDAVLFIVMGVICLDRAFEDKQTETSMLHGPGQTITIGACLCLGIKMLISIDGVIDPITYSKKHL